MALADFTNEVLTYLDVPANGGNWDLGNFSPHPTLIDGDEESYFDGGIQGRASDADATTDLLITVDNAPTGTNEPIGTEFQFRIFRGVRVVIEAYHEDGATQGDQVADKDEFDSMVGEARRAILNERSFPVSGAGFNMTDLRIENEADGSPTDGDAHYFRYEFEVWFRGFEDPDKGFSDTVFEVEFQAPFIG
jgi:hypothetical protein